MRPPYGQQWNTDKSRLLLDPETAPIVRLIFDWALEGVSLRGIVLRLQRRGIPSPSGKPQCAPSVLRDLLRRTVYSGTVTAYQTRQVRLSNGSCQRSKRGAEERIAPVIITEDEQKAVLARLDANQAAATRNNKEPEATLLRAGFIYCGHCGNLLTVARHPKSGASYRCDWGTAARHHCPRPTILAHMIDSVVWEVVAKILRDPDTIAHEVARSRDDGSLVRELAVLDRMLA